MVLEAQQEELQRGHGGQAVINIVEGALIDVELALPAGTAAIEGQVVEIDPGAVLVLQFQPDGVALVRGKVGILVHPVLELVHDAAIGQEEEAVLGVEQGVFLSVLAKEQMVPGSRQELHGHGMDLGALHAGALEVCGDLGVTLGHIALKGVAALVGQHVHVSRGVVPVGKDKGGLVGGQAGHIAAGHLAGAALHVEQLIVLHEVNEFCGLGAQLVVHGAGGGHPGIVAGDGRGIAVLKRHRQIGEGQVGDAGALAAQLDHLFQLGHHIAGHLVAELPDLGRAVADAVHPHIGKLAVIVVAQDLRLCVQVLDDLGVQAVQLVTVGIEIRGLGLVGGAADGRVQILLVGAQLGNGQLLAVKLDQCAAVHLLVLADKGVVLLLQLHGAVIHAQHGILHASHAGGAKGFGQRVHMGVGQKCPADLHPCVLHGGTVGIKEILLGLPISVTGVAGVVDACQLCGGAVIGKGAALLVVNIHQLLAAGCPGGLCGQRLALAQQGINVRAGITHFAEFHGIHPFVPSCLSAEPILARLGKKGNGKEELPLWRKVCQNCKR